MSGERFLVARPKQKSRQGQLRTAVAGNDAWASPRQPRERRALSCSCMRLRALRCSLARRLASCSSRRRRDTIIISSLRRCISVSASCQGIGSAHNGLSPPLLGELRPASDGGRHGRAVRRPVGLADDNVHTGDRLARIHPTRVQSRNTVRLAREMWQLQERVLPSSRTQALRPSLSPRRTLLLLVCSTLPGAVYPSHPDRPTAIIQSARRYIRPK